jgi:predicted SAM-dependent methyltransferase
MKKLNMWCGNDIFPWYLNRDIIKLPWVDEVYDFEKFPYPFKDNEFDEIYCSHVLEHMNNLWKVMEEFNRIGKKWCKIKVKVPYFASPNARWDYTHKRTFNTNTFNYFHENCYYNTANIIVKEYKIHYFWNKQFFVSDIINIIPDFIINLLPKIYERFFAYRFPASEIHYLLEVKK